MNEWMNDWMNEWVNEWMNEWVNGEVSEWVSNKWMNEQMNEWMNEWKYERLRGCLPKCVHWSEFNMTVSSIFLFSPFHHNYFSIHQCGFVQL